MFLRPCDSRGMLYHETIHHRPAMTPEHLHEIEELYHAACRDRSVLANADPELRLEVESLLAHEAKPLPDLSFAASFPDESQPEPAAPPIAPGTYLGPYLIEESLGAGGMGQVFCATDTRLNRKVAVKICAQQFSG